MIDPTAASRPLVVVLAEDELLIRMAMADVLGDAGFEVIEAEHAEAAVALLTSRKDEVHLLFTDIHMTGAMDGLQLAHHVSILWPWIGILITSGKAHPKPVEMPPGSRFLSKPYRPEQVMGHLRELADAPQSTRPPPSAGTP